MPIVSFADYIPQARFDDLPWTAVRIEEAASAAGSWTEVETINLVDIGGLDSDPAKPSSRSFTTESATLDSGWYRVVFIDENLDESTPTEAIHNIPPYGSLSDLTPTAEDVAALLRARTKDGTWSKPTSDQVDIIILLARGSVLGRLRAPVPYTQIEAAKFVITLEAARQVEASYYAEQINTEYSMYVPLTTAFDAALEDLKDGCRYPITTTLA